MFTSSIPDGELYADHGRCHDSRRYCRNVGDERAMRGSMVVEFQSWVSVRIIGSRQCVGGGQPIGSTGSVSVVGTLTARPS